MRAGHDQRHLILLLSAITHSRLHWDRRHESDYLTLSPGIWKASLTHDLASRNRAPSQIECCAAKHSFNFAKRGLASKSSFYNDRQGDGGSVMRFAIFAAVVVSHLSLPALAQQPAVVLVGTVKAERRPIEKTLDFVGRVEAVNRVEIRARVQGYLEAVLFNEGDEVKEGWPLM
jgi:hypothetical protein